jgi:hypothetical protein
MRIRGWIVAALLVAACQAAPATTPISAEAAASAALAAVGDGHDAKVVATRLSTFGAEAPMGGTADPATVVWAVSLSGRFEPGSCGPAPAGTATPNPCPSPQTSERILIDATTGAFLLGSIPDPGASAVP